MRLRYTERALSQIAAVLAYVDERSPKGAARLRDSILRAGTLLTEQPRAGQVTDRAGVRRLVLTSHPYVLFYRVTSDDIIVMRLRHAARAPSS